MKEWLRDSSVMFQIEHMSSCKGIILFLSLLLTVVETEYDTTQGEPVAEKEVGRGSVGQDAFKSPHS